MNVLKCFHPCGLLWHISWACNHPDDRRTSMKLWNQLVKNSTLPITHLFSVPMNYIHIGLEHGKHYTISTYTHFKCTIYIRDICYLCRLCQILSHNTVYKLISSPTAWEQIHIQSVVLRQKQMKRAGGLAAVCHWGAAAPEWHFDIWPSIESQGVFCCVILWCKWV